MSYNRSIENEFQRGMLVKYILAKDKLPFTVSIAEGKHRSSEQNRLQRKWMTEIAEQIPGDDAEHWRGYCKLHFGVPILRNENEAFKREYDEIIRPMPYEIKLKLMMVPFDFGVTRLMNTKQKTAYLDRINRHFSEQGVVLTQPEDKRYGRVA